MLLYLTNKPFVLASVLLEFDFKNLLFFCILLLKEDLDVFLKSIFTISVLAQNHIVDINNTFYYFKKRNFVATLDDVADQMTYIFALNLQLKYFNEFCVIFY